MVNFMTVPITTVELSMKKTYPAIISLPLEVHLLSLALVDDIQVWDYEANDWFPITKYNPHQKACLAVDHQSFVHHRRFEGTKSRKGYLHTKWRLGQTEFELVNVHLYHDDNNTVAIQNIPSKYADQRSVALAEAVRKCQLSDQSPTFIFGDYNFRLDGDFVPWLEEQCRKNYGIENEHKEQFLSIEDKSFSFKFSNEIFGDDRLREKIFQFDREPIRFNQREAKTVQLQELPIRFPPSYCLSIGSAPKNGFSLNYTKRIPAWADRILFNGGARYLLKGSDYNSVIDSQSTGDHRPVYLSVSIPFTSVKHK